MNPRLLASVAAVSLCFALPAASQDVEGMLKELAETQLAAWVADPSVVQTLRDQNAAHANLAQADIDALDLQWRAEVGQSDTPLISEVLGRSTSEYLREQKNGMDGLITEVFVMDNHGLNAAQSDLTSDYWQGDEDKFQKTYGMGVGSIHIGEVELDESSGSYQSQVSMVIADPDTGAAIGAVTFGVNVDYLQ